ncbi:MAG: exonuclease SbcCD subunit D [Hyphomicrobiaceae bacterium]
MPSLSPRQDERAVVLVHSSDLHIDDDITPGQYHGLDGLQHVLGAAHTVNADVVLLAGDTFDNGRVSETIARRAGALLAEARMPVIMLPGNHDPAMADGIYHRSGILGLEQAMVIGHTHPECIVMADLDLEILGRPHRSHNDMSPLPIIPPRTTRWQVIIAHGHYVPPEDWADETHRSWLISEADLGATGVDYVALGHWDRPVAVGDGRVAAYYSGAPDLAQTVNVVRLDPKAGVSVERRPLAMPFARRW